jgi:LPS-assembly protein
VAVVLLQTALAVAQQPPPPTPQPPPAAPKTTTTTTTPESNIPQIDDVHSDRQELTNGQKTQHHIGHVELVTGDMTIYADDAWYYTDEHRFVATGNVVFAQGQNRITAEKAEFDTNTRLGTFYTAWGVAPVKPPPQRSGGFAPPQLSGNQEATVIFFGETIKKVGPKKYEILKGGFTTCLQPTPRWDLLADKITLNIDHYTLMRDAVLSVKGVPMFYLPVLYYPTKREGRATGLLLPTYGQSSLRGQSIHNAFFWAIDRSQDATLLHDWFSKTGQGLGGEYRYNYAPTGDGTLRAYLLDQHEAVYPQADGTSRVSPASRSYEIRGGSNQALPGRIRARASVEYFSSIVTSQTFNTNVYDATRNQRSFGGNLVGAWSSYSLNGTFDHREYFYDPINSVLSGSWPRLALTRNEKPLFGSPIYFQFGTEYAHFLRDQRTATGDINSNLSRFDIVPQIRFPFKKWQWFTVNTTANWRDTYYSRRQDPVTRQVVDEGLNRRVYTLQSQIVGPVFNRIWDTPDNGFAEKFKHAVEPFLGIQRTSSVENFREIISFDGIDSYVGGTRYTYGLGNRIYAKVRQNPGQPSQSREIVGVEVAQSYYTNQGAAQYDRQYQTQTGNEAPTFRRSRSASAHFRPTTSMERSARSSIPGITHSAR